LLMMNPEPRLRCLNSLRGMSPKNGQKIIPERRAAKRRTETTPSFIGFRCADIDNRRFYTLGQIGKEAGV